MIFNSLEFFLFLFVVFAIYWSIPKNENKYRNIVLLIASYFFYGYWDWRFLGLIFFSSIIDFLVGKAIYQTANKTKARAYLMISLFINLATLGFFKYFNFFIDNAIIVLQQIGFRPNIHTLEIILPVGISFYTFQTLSYTLDIFKKKLEPTYNPINFFTFVSFFPQLVAGPIERAANLLPQFSTEKVFQYKSASIGARLIIWGLFKKVVIADNCAIYADQIFNTTTYAQTDGLMLFFGALMFSLQIYGDFSGYSDIAIGTARLFGFQLMTNFKQPYFSATVTEFWRKWHISLSQWFRDYVYIPLGGNQKGIYWTIINLMITFIVSGFWHGANWTFIAWGFLNGLYLVVHLFIRDKNKSDKVIWQNLPKIAFVFILTTFTWIFFRAENISSALNFVYYVPANFEFKQSIVELYNFIYWDFTLTLTIIFSAFLSVEWLFRNKNYVLEMDTIPTYGRFLAYGTICILIALYGNWNNSEFIYFQF